MEFYRADPTSRSSWRLAILMGANSRTYKFALGQALLSLAAQGQEDVPLMDLARPYAMELAKRAQAFPQAPSSRPLGPADFLTMLAEETPQALSTGTPSERLVAAAEASMPSMVMQKFHNLRGIGEVPHRFYRLTGQGPKRRVLLSPSLRELAATDLALLEAELSARWSLVETSFDAGIGPSLVRTGVLVSDNAELLLDRVRRAPVAKARSALVGFQHGRCFYCQQPIRDLDVDVHVDHVYPFSRMTNGSWTGPDLNGIWNLVVSCAACNLAKSNRLPTDDEVQRLIDRNDAILLSPHPLRRTLDLLVRVPGDQQPSTSEGRLSFYRAVDLLATGQ